MNRWKDPGLEVVKRRLKDELLERIVEAHDPLPVRECAGNPRDTSNCESD